MECNKEEAIRAKTIAEKKLEDKDFTGAKKFTLKSQTLYPGLDGISQMLTTVNVYIAHEKKINGESDWYAVLDVKPSDDDETIRKQYRKMVLMLHPDKNKLVGADGAFKILSEAWNLLSDKSKRSAYNQRTRIPQKVSFQSALSSSVSVSPQFVKVVPKPTSKPKNPKPPARAQTQQKPKPKAKAPVPPRPPAPAPVARAPSSFWTVCHGCNMHYEYYKVYLNQTLMCQSCQKPFRAVEIAKPVSMPKTNGGSGPQVHNTVNLSGASKAKMARSCEEFNAQRLWKKRKDDDGGQSGSGGK
ncbi:uncharacterized protein LOC143540946 [Bidens hawaiensis]|uniref:uncharacterized protein LOC143540946 n=1 Tax=Bidens hawaiensis TaxID=980011 RepID=UPI00404A1420